MIVTNEEELAGMKTACNAVARVRDYLVQVARPSMSTIELDKIAGEKMKEFDLVSAPKSVYDFPGNVCISVNECVAHGVPSDYILQDGDTVNFDVSGSLGEYFGDTGASVIVGNDKSKQRVIDCSIDMFGMGKKYLKDKGHFRDMSKAMEKCAKKYGYNVIGRLTGHGIGKSLHDNPHSIYCKYYRWDSRRFKENMVVAIETFVSVGAGEVYIGEDNWSWITVDKSFTAQYEHTVLITKKGPEILTL